MFMFLTVFTYSNDNFYDKENILTPNFNIIFLSIKLL